MHIFNEFTYELPSLGFLCTTLGLPVVTSSFAFLFSPFPPLFFPLFPHRGEDYAPAFALNFPPSSPYFGTFGTNGTNWNLHMRSSDKNGTNGTFGKSKMAAIKISKGRTLFSNFKVFL